MFARLYRIASLAALAFVAACSNAPAEIPPLYDSAVVGGFELQDAQGQTVSSEDFAGRYQMVYFGYAYCPDICPFDMAKMVRGLESFEEANPEFAGQIQPIFITIDPARDTPEVIAEWTSGFSEDLIGLTGSPEAIAAAAGNYFVQYSQQEPNARGDYLMDHTRLGYLVDREGQPMALLPVDQSPEAVAAELEKWVR
ncbi:conserved exported hypothetical protein [Erythrobacter sp. EC-HK427]|nr:conserved exported hypothetical protein [Erythrobacter sp. EC-HK427]